MKEKSDDKDDLVHENLGNWQNILYCDPIKTLARSALRWKSCCFQSGAGNMEGEFEDGFEGIFLERRASKTPTNGSGLNILCCQQSSVNFKYYTPHIHIM